MISLVKVSNTLHHTTSKKGYYIGYVLMTNIVFRGWVHVHQDVKPCYTIYKHEQVLIIQMIMDPYNSHGWWLTSQAWMAYYQPVAIVIEMGDYTNGCLVIRIDYYS